MKIADDQLLWVIPLDLPLCLYLPQASLVCSLIYTCAAAVLMCNSRFRVELAESLYTEPVEHYSYDTFVMHYFA